MKDNNLTFSQEQGLEPLPEPLAIGELSERLRNRIWSAMYDDLASCRGSDYIREDTTWCNILKDIHVNFMDQPSDEFSRYVPTITSFYKPVIMNAPYNEVLDIVQFILRNPNCSFNFLEKITNAFNSCQAAYNLIDGDTIVPCSSKQEAETYLAALKETNVTSFTGARKHLKNAGENLAGGKWPDSIRESIHAVESVMKVLAKDESADFHKAIQKLSKQVEFHGALKQGFEKIYAYTSDENGIRHSLLDESSKVDRNDAFFMLSSCSAFVTFLINKAREQNLLEHKKAA